MQEVVIYTPLEKMFFDGLSNPIWLFFMKWLIIILAGGVMISIISDNIKRKQWAKKWAKKWREKCIFPKVK